MGYYENELRKIAEFHEEQATSLERDSHLDGLYGAGEGASRAAERVNSVQSHRAKASGLSAEADRAS
ncbi:hypothetical protein [Streptomyces canus]|uniref:hypothetical protein n=1 Tax=Streptomyces canus TaxID=58343 RepID=UPI00277F43A3|nr:hypothetical protein [Streptomyces canus]MDQ0758727.1 hypothetical protein [Streptomyces canus]